MSELINTYDNRATIRWKLLATVSAIALSGYISTTAFAKAEDADRPLLWIDLGGQMELMQKTSAEFTAPFMSAITPTPEPYHGDIFSKGQQPARFAFGLDGKVMFQPEKSDWVFAAEVRYGRSHGNRHIHNQTPYYFHSGIYSSPLNAAPFADVSDVSSEKHAVLDFSAGRDVGIGRLGSRGTSTISAGVRFAQFSSASNVGISARPSLEILVTYHVTAHFYQYKLHGHTKRDFRGVGPSLTWNASAPLVGNVQDGEVTLDWGLDAAILFGRQKADTDHATTENHFMGRRRYPTIYQTGNSSTRSRRIAVPNLGGFAGLSYRYVDAKIGIGYRYDTFLNAMDTGIDAAKKSNVTFNGPYASISIGLGD